MNFSVLSLVILASLVTAVPAPQGRPGRNRPSAAAATPAAATPAATSAAAAVPAPAVSSKASVAAPAPAVSSQASAVGGTTAGAGAGTAAGAGTVAGAGTTAGGAASAATTGASSGSADTASGGNSHKVTVNNNCGSGSVQWQYDGKPRSTFPGSSTTVDGPIVAGIIWLDNYNGFACGDNALNCGMVELTVGAANGFNGINYSLLMGVNGNHVLRAPMFIELTAGTCSGKAKGPCTGMTAAECPNGYTGLDTNTGPPVVCSGSGVGASITFCP